MESLRDHVPVDTKNLRIHHLRIVHDTESHRMIVHCTIAYIEEIPRPMVHGGYGLGSLGDSR